MPAACEALGIPVVSGNVSLYNDTDGRSIHPTPVVGCVGLVADVRTVPGTWREGDAIYLAGEPELSFDGSEYQALYGELGGRPARLDLAREAELIEFSAHDRAALLVRPRRLRGRPRDRARGGRDRERDRRRARSARRRADALRRRRRPGVVACAPSEELRVPLRGSGPSVELRCKVFP